MATRKMHKVAPTLKTLDAYLDSEANLPKHVLEISSIQLPPQQPRRYFDETKLSQLVQSIKEHGILEPLLIRRVSHGRYELVAGERRLRAAKQAGLTEVPVVISELDELQAFQVSLIENLQREDLNPIEETEGILQLLAISLETTSTEIISLLHQAYNARQRNKELNQNVLIQLQRIDSILDSIGKFSAETFRSTRLPLLNLPEEVLLALRQGQIEYTKAQLVARVKNPDSRKKLLEDAIEQRLSVSDIKEKVKILNANLQTLDNKDLQHIAAKRLSVISKQILKGDVWQNSKNRKRISQLLDELETLTGIKVQQ